MFGPRMFGPTYFGATFFGQSGTATLSAPAPSTPSAGSGGSRSCLRPFPAGNYPTPVVHRARVSDTEDGDPVDSWPGSGTTLYCHAGQADPQTRWTQQAEENLTKWVLWFSLPALVEAEVTIRRGDRLTLSPASGYGDDVVLRASADATDYNLRGVSVMVAAEQVE